MLLVVVVDAKAVEDEELVEVVVVLVGDYDDEPCCMGIARVMLRLASLTADGGFAVLMMLVHC